MLKRFNNELLARMAKATSRKRWKSLRGGTRANVMFSLAYVQRYKALNYGPITSEEQEKLLNAYRPHAELHRMITQIARHGVNSKPKPKRNHGLDNEIGSSSERGRPSSADVTVTNPTEPVL